MGVTTSANRPLAASKAATTRFPTAAKSATAVTVPTTAVGASSSAAMETASAAAMGTATASAVTTAATVLSVDCVWGESETNKRCERYQGLEQSGSAHNLYLPHDVKAPLRARSPIARRAGSYLIRF